jgi:hypothetical protein
MKDNSTQAAGQQNIDGALLSTITHLCDSMQVLRAWWVHFEPSLRKVDRAAAVQAHDVIVDGVIDARQVARTLGISLPSVDALDWKLAPRPSPGSPTAGL